MSKSLRIPFRTQALGFSAHVAQIFDLLYRRLAAWYVDSVGGAGDPPAPLGDSPSGTGEGVRAERSTQWFPTCLAIRSVGSPDGTGESPVLPALNSYAACGRGLELAAFVLSTLCRLQVGDTADFKSALRGRENASARGLMAGFRAALICILLVVASGGGSLSASVVFETTSPYHHIRVVDQNGVRTLSFDQSQESRMSLANPLTGHFQYTEFFHMTWLFNPEMKSVLMIGLGGGSIQRAYQYYYPDVSIDTVELDPTVVQIAKKYFFVHESPTFRVHVSDGRLYLRRTEKKYDAIIMDAYKWSRYGSFIPYHLVTKEFFELARDHLTEDGVVAYNVIGALQGWRADILGAVYKTMKSVFPQVFLFPATDSWNIVMIASKKPDPLTLPILQPRVNELISRGRATMPTFPARVNAFQAIVPSSSRNAPVLTDDHAPVDGLLSRVPSTATRRPPSRGAGSDASPSQPPENDKAKAP